MIRRILFVDEDQERNGATVSLEYLVQGFKESGYDPVVLTWKQEEWAKARLRESASLIDGRWGPVTSLTMCFHFTYTASPLSWAGLRNILKDVVKFVAGFFVVRRVIRRVKPALVYLNEYSVVQAALAARSCGIPVAMHIRSRMLGGMFGVRRRFMARMVLRYSDVVFPITRLEADQLQARPHEEPGIHVVGEFVPMGREPQGTGVRGRKMFELPEDRKVVVMMGGIQSIKGTRDFLLAAVTVLSRYPGAVFAIAGGTRMVVDPVKRAYYDSCMKLVGSLQQFDGIRLLGEITNPLDFVAMCDILVAPNLETHFSRPVVEAWGMGKPVVVYRSPHMDQLVSHETDGLLVESGYVEGLASSMLRLLESPELCQQLGAAGMKKARLEFDAKKNLDRIITHCSSLIEAS